ncbi:MAG: hypothetical protein ACLUNQ_02365 [Oscillospiraceae bacterium]
MALSLLPVSVLAADDHTGQVHVTVENTTWAMADGAPWEGSWWTNGSPSGLTPP